MPFRTERGRGRVPFLRCAPGAILSSGQWLGATLDVGSHPGATAPIAHPLMRETNAGESRCELQLGWTRLPPARRRWF